MKSTMNNPSRKSLVILALISGLVFFVLSIKVSFIWLIGEVIIHLICIGSFIILFLSWLVDKIWRIRIFKYGLVIFTAFWIVTISLFIWKKIISTEFSNQELNVVSKIEKYKIKNGHYPKDLKESYFNDLPQKTIFNSDFDYLYIDDTTFSLNYWIIERGTRFYDKKRGWDWVD